jgi:hypothetical protein
MYRGLLYVSGAHVHTGLETRVQSRLRIGLPALRSRSIKAH